MNDLGATEQTDSEYLNGLMEKYSDESDNEQASDSLSSDDDALYAEGQKEQENENDLSLEDQLKAFDEKSDDSENSDESKKVGNDLLSSLNELGITRNETPVEFKDVDEVKELLSKGYDYTVKTQELANQRKEQEETFTQREQEFNQRFEELQTFENDNKEMFAEYNAFQRVLHGLEQSDPDVFNELLTAFEREIGSYNQIQNNPVINSQTEKINALEKQIEELRNGKTEDENKSIASEWETGKQDVQKEFGAKLQKLGLQPNWQAMEKVWAADTTGKMTAKEAFFATHGEKLAKALDAFNKAQKTKSDSDLRLGKRYAPKGVNIEDKPETRMEYLERIANKYAG